MRECNSSAPRTTIRLHLMFVKISIELKIVILMIEVVKALFEFR